MLIGFQEGHINKFRKSTILNRIDVYDKDMEKMKKFCICLVLAQLSAFVFAVSSYITKDSVVQTPAAHSLRAEWKQTFFKVSYDLNLPADAVGELPDSPSGKVVLVGNKVSHDWDADDYLDRFEELDNYLFCGWYDKDGNKVEDGDVLDPDGEVEVVLRGRWKAVEYFDIRIRCYIDNFQKSTILNRIDVYDEDMRYVGMVDGVFADQAWNNISYSYVDNYWRGKKHKKYYLVASGRVFSTSNQDFYAPNFEILSGLVSVDNAYVAFDGRFTNYYGVPQDLKNNGNGSFSNSYLAVYDVMANEQYIFLNNNNAEGKHVFVNGKEVPLVEKDGNVGACVYSYYQGVNWSPSSAINVRVEYRLVRDTFVNCQYLKIPAEYSFTVSPFIRVNSFKINLNMLKMNGYWQNGTVADTELNVTATVNGYSSHYPISLIYNGSRMNNVDNYSTLLYVASIRELSSSAAASIGNQYFAGSYYLLSRYLGSGDVDIGGWLMDVYFTVKYGNYVVARLKCSGMGPGSRSFVFDNAESMLLQW